MLLIRISEDVISLATELNLTGYVHNMLNGTVGIGLDENRAQADKLIEKLKNPGFTQIDRISIEEHPSSTGAQKLEIR